MDHFITYLNGLSAAQLTGVSGFFCYMLSFGAVQLGRLDGNSTAYSLCNILAASLVAVSLIEEFNLSSALIQGSWITLGLVGLSLRAAKAWASTRRVLNTTLEQEA
ncbi:CBU_0592 family membrane protein [Pseudooctadecabacter jejudonensis]|uniref:CBU-0592-like domain-containing protein n=1 Tax=Pseudooctadecabacter jejudonensis TaxID=1391910 RepID=A0A1Y5TCJ8_9RHOB|nr:hypothetical protein [Pseudooctadecabacter jejudonensis]SLN60858.1 hypothetical protein PSJ8397_03251 [Pseudooctadecabacter jejudonensis]